MGLIDEFAIGTLAAEAVDNQMPGMPPEYKYAARQIQWELTVPPQASLQAGVTPTTADGYSTPGRGQSGESVN